jgi:hypothetical protein
VGSGIRIKTVLVSVGGVVVSVGGVVALAQNSDSKAEAVRMEL